MRLALLALLAACADAPIVLDGGGATAGCRPVTTQVQGGEVYSYDLSWHSSGEWLATGTSSTVRLFAAGSDTPLELLDAHDGPARFNGVAFTPDGRLLAPTGTELRVYDIVDDRLVQRGVLATHAADLQRVAVSSSGTRVLTCDVDGVVMLYRLDPNRVPELLDARVAHDRCTRVAFSPSGLRASSAGHGGGVPLFDVSDDRLVLLDTLDVGVGEVGEVRFVQDDVLYAGAFSAPYTLWKLNTAGDTLAVDASLGGHRSGFSSLDLSPDGSQLLTGDHDDTMHLYDIDGDGTLTHRLDVARDGLGVHTARFAPDGHTVGHTASAIDVVERLDLNDCAP